MNYFSYLVVAQDILSAYKPGQPFNIYLKSYFRKNKKYGSRDRKLISALCYNYFRLGPARQKFSMQERLLTGFFLVEQRSSEFLQSIKPEWDDKISCPIGEKLKIANWEIEIKNLFPFKSNLSKEINPEKFSLSFLKQPKLFLRIRPGFNRNVLQKLLANKISYEVLGEECLALPSSSKIDAIVDLNKEAVVQDYNSQKVGDILKPVFINFKAKIEIWDCCAGSGGKSLMAYDRVPLAELVISDKREPILKNLTLRFAAAGIKNYRSFVADLSGYPAAGRAKSALEANGLAGKTFDLIIADVPCTGSGTWARTPEQLYYFDKRQIAKYSELQKQIVENVFHFVKPGGHLLYSTCSVFKEENEEVADFIINKLEMNLVKMKILKGDEMRADTMFAALFVAAK